MKNLALDDPTQVEILRHLAVTERLLAQVASELSGTEQSAQICAMPDLGLPHNITRITGGFYTGALYSWETRVPFVPVDSTMNSCGVSVFRLRDTVESKEQFDTLIQNAISKGEKHGTYIWNFANGNHFVTYGCVSGSKTLPDGPYVVLHASACEFKNQEYGLYPREGNWYYDKIQIVRTKHENRFLRYIAGSIAERFIGKAQQLDAYNSQRHRYFAELIFGSYGLDHEVLNISHYGMPTPASIAIGCQWRNTVFLLLSAPGRPLFFVEPMMVRRGSNDHVQGGIQMLLTPHGFGIESCEALKINYEPVGVTINGVYYEAGASLRGNERFEIRQTLNSNEEVIAHVEKILQKCPGSIIATLTPIYSYHHCTTNARSVH